MNGEVRNNIMLCTLRQNIITPQVSTFPRGLSPSSSSPHVNGLGLCGKMGPNKTFNLGRPDQVNSASCPGVDQDKSASDGYYYSACNILIDDEFNAKVSDFGLAKLLGAGKSHVTTRVMGTFGYVAPEFANTGLLNGKGDVYSFGVLLLEAITGRDPVDYGRPAPEVNLVDWLKMMVGSRRSEEVVDPNIEVRTSTRALKRALLTALRCVDPDSGKRPKMSQVVRMLESEEYPIPREDRRHHRSRGGSLEIDSQRDNSDTDRSDYPGSRSESKRTQL
ncbi:hypothetical protein SLE2022_141190 [Rubroshorea leprosula]